MLAFFDFISNASKFVLKLTAVGVLFALFSFTVFKAPELHQSYLRNFVGGQVVILLGDRSGGTGFVMNITDTKQVIITNRHVCNSAVSQEGHRYLFARLPNGQTLPRRVLLESTKHDLCAVETIPNHSGLGLGSSINVGDKVAIVGHPALYPLRLSVGEFTGDFIISLLSKCSSKEILTRFYFFTPEEKQAAKQYFNNIFEEICELQLHSHQITAYSRGGSSGSPVVNFYGNVIGVLFAGNRNDPHDSYMVPREYLAAFIEELK